MELRREVREPRVDRLPAGLVERGLTSDLDGPGPPGRPDPLVEGTGVVAFLVVAWVLGGLGTILTGVAPLVVSAAFGHGGRGDHERGPL